MNNTINDYATGGEVVYDVLRAENVSAVFGLLGGSMLEFYDAMFKQGEIKYYGARDERAAGHMADVYARVSGGPGVVLGAQAGPGVVNLVTAVAEAHLAYSPLVVIAGAISRQDLGKDTFQEVDQVSLFAPICKRSIMVNTVHRLGPMLQHAIRLAMSGRRGPVVLHVPRDLFSEKVERRNDLPISPVHKAQASDDDIQSMLKMLEAASAPVIFAGGGFKWSAATEQLRQLAERLDIPVVASTGHADIMPHNHDLYAGQSGPRGNWVASKLTANADFILVLGARLGFNSTFHSNEYVNKKAKIVQVDIEGSAIGRYFPVDLGIQADAALSTNALSKAVARHGMDNSRWMAWTEQFKQDKLKLRQQRIREGEIDDIPIKPVRALAEIREALTEDALVTLDTGNACLQAADRLAHYQSPGLITPLDFGLVGFAYAAAIGASIAAPQRPIIALMGDGGFGFTLAEITTVVKYELPIIAIVLDNNAWGAEKAYQQEFFGGRLLGAEIDNPPYDQVATLCGAKGYCVNEPGQLYEVLKIAIAEKQSAVIHVKIDPDALSTLRKDLF